MFKSAKQLKKETDETFQEILEREIKCLIDKFNSQSTQAKRDGLYKIYLYTETNSDAELVAMRVIRRELKEKGYKCGFIWTQDGWTHNYYEMKVSWKKIK